MWLLTLQPKISILIITFVSIISVQGDTPGRHQLSKEPHIFLWKMDTNIVVKYIYYIFLITLFI